MKVLLSRRPKWFSITIALAVFLLLLTVRTIQSRFNSYEAPSLAAIEVTPSPTRPESCVPLPGGQGVEASTPTPEHGKAQPYNVKATLTPIPVTRTIDLNPDLAEKYKSVFYVFRCNGDYDEILAGPDVPFVDAVDLGPGDVVLRAIQPKHLMGGKPEEPTMAYPAPPAQSPTEPGYPYP